jgi:hypothetical protein
VASWLNAVKSFFAKLAKKRLQRDMFCSVVELQAAISRFLAEPTPTRSHFGKQRMIRTKLSPL